MIIGAPKQLPIGEAIKAMYWRCYSEDGKEGELTLGEVIEEIDKIKGLRWVLMGF